MRIIPKKTKVSTEFFKGVSLADILVGFFGILIMFFVFISSLPGKLWIELVLFFIFGLLLVRIDDEPNYMFLLQLLRHFSHERRFQKLTSAPPIDGKKKRKKKDKPSKANGKRSKKQKKTPKKPNSTGAVSTLQQDGSPAEGISSDASEADISDVVDDISLEETAPVTEGSLQEMTPMSAKEKRLAAKARKRTAKKTEE